jgi:hypothetical protein
VEQQVEAAITEVLAAAGADRPRQLTQLLLASAYGVGRKATSPAEIGPAIRLLTERLLRPELKEQVLTDRPPHPASPPSPTEGRRP